jgi:type II secretory ATPase GspE/PulE/Tfp pilus assembly ATPase PilB-like protein
VTGSESVAGVTCTRGAGCGACRGTGYRGRLGVFELFTLSDETKHAIAANASRADLLALARAEGMRSLMADGWTKVVAAETTIEEVWRVAQG